MNLNIANMKPLLVTLALLTGLPLFGIGNLEPIEGWEKVAAGVWKAQIGDVDEELAYTSLAARGPRLEVLNGMTEVPFPFGESEIEFLQTDDRMIQVRIPVDANESIYGFGLQLDGIKKSKKILDLNVDHWAKGGGRTHAPVPFYISSKGLSLIHI